MFTKDRVSLVARFIMALIFVFGIFDPIGKVGAIPTMIFARSSFSKDVGLKSRVNYHIDSTSDTIVIPALKDWQTGNIAFSRGSKGEWDYYLWGGFANSLIKKDNVYYLYYQGSPSYNDQCESVSYRGIGLATSIDGVNWIKSDNNPVISWSDQGSIEEGAVSSAAWVGDDGRFYIYYGANTGSNCTINSSARLSVSEDGETFQDLGEVLSGNDPNVWGSGDEIFPVGVYSYEKNWYLYYIPNGVPNARKLGVAMGNSYDNYTQTSGLNNSTIRSWGPTSIILRGPDAVLFTNPNGGNGPINIYNFSTNNPSSVRFHDSYLLPDCSQASVIYHDIKELWMMSCRDTRAENYLIKYASPIPTVSSITRADISPTIATSVDFTVSFSESVTGVDMADFSPKPAGGVTGESVTGVSGSGTTYTVTVNTGSGNGTLGLDVVDDDSIQDASNNPLGGVGAGNGYFTSGRVYTIVKNTLYSNRKTVDIGDQLYYTKSDPKITTLTNYQATDVHIGSFIRSGGQFILSSNNCVGATLTPGQSCTFNLQFKPRGYGALAGTLIINSDATNDPVLISLDGVGLPGTQLVTQGGSFEQDNDNDTIPDSWDTTGLTELDGRSDQYAKHGFYSMKIVGQSGATKTLKQTIVKNGSAGEDFLYVLWSKAENVPDGFYYRTQISFYNGTSLVERRIKDYTAGTHDWEYKWLPITVSGNYTRIEVEIIYSLASGTVWFDSDSLKWAP